MAKVKDYVFPMYSDVEPHKALWHISDSLEALACRGGFAVGRLDGDVEVVAQNVIALAFERAKRHGAEELEGFLEIRMEAEIAFGVGEGVDNHRCDEVWLGGFYG